MNKSNIRLQAVAARQLKISYKGLDDKQKRYIKAKERYEQYDKALAYFYSHCKRTTNGAVDFENMTEAELDKFEEYNKEKNKAFRAMSRLEEQIDVDYTLSLFLQINTHSMSF